jgi:hypothetical protein
MIMQLKSDNAAAYAEGMAAVLYQAFVCGVAGGVVLECLCVSSVFILTMARKYGFPFQKDFDDSGRRFRYFGGYKLWMLVKARKLCYR